MDTRDTPEQAEFRRTARRLARELGPRTVAALDERARRARLAAAVRDAGWLQMRWAGEHGDPVASGVEAATIAEALGETVADVSFAGPTLAADLARRAGVRHVDGAVVAFSQGLVEAAVVSGSTTERPILAVDPAAEDSIPAYVLVPERDGHRLALVEVDAPRDGADLTRAVRAIPAGTRVRSSSEPSRLLQREDLEAWAALGLALTSADLVGIMRGVLDVTVEYARERKQYGVAIGSFQAVQHLLAEARCLMEGALSVALYSAWAVDQLGAKEASAAGRVAKAYCARAARTVCETAVQVHGGIGNTWDCIAHLYLRRALLSAQWFGDDGEQLRQIEQARLGVTYGLS